jgi:hypothetical protein
MRSNLIVALLIAAVAAHAQAQQPAPTSPPPLPVPLATPPSKAVPTKAPANLVPAAAPVPGTVASVSAPPPGLAIVPAPKPGSRSASALEEEEQQAQIDKLDRAIALTNKKIELMNAETNLLSRQGGTRAPTGIPTLIGMTGTKDHLVAKFLYDGRTIVYGRIGDTLPSQYRIDGLAANRAVLIKEGTRIELAMTYTREGAPTGAPVPQPYPSVPVDSAGPIIGRTGR